VTREERREEAELEKRLQELAEEAGEILEKLSRIRGRGIRLPPPRIKPLPRRNKPRN
jgi:hypothetical protein